MTEFETGYVKVTVDFVVKSETPEQAKLQLDSIMRSSRLPMYKIRSDTVSASI